jgi:hypothetical protein
MTISRRPEGTYAPRSTKWIEDGRHATNYQQKRRRRIATKEPINQDHLAVTTVLGIKVKVNDLGRHHQDDTTVQRTRKPDDPELLIERMTTKTMKRRWGRHALPVGFASRQYPKVSNYRMTSKSMTDLKSHSHGFQTTYKQCKY